MSESLRNYQCQMKSCDYWISPDALHCPDCGRGTNGGRTTNCLTEKETTLVAVLNEATQALQNLDRRMRDTRNDRRRGRKERKQLLQSITDRREHIVGEIERCRAGIRRIAFIRWKNRLTAIVEGTYDIFSLEDVERAKVEFARMRTTFGELDLSQEQNEEAEEQLTWLFERIQAREEVVREVTDNEQQGAILKALQEWEGPALENPELERMFFTNFPVQVEGVIQSDESEELLNALDLFAFDGDGKGPDDMSLA